MAKCLLECQARIAGQPGAQPLRQAEINVGAGLCGSWLACDAVTSVHQLHSGDAIAGEPAPTLGLWRS
ncbi:hypothetical protein F7R12_01000 [Pseudomonas tolaasii]|nr:hypothetical protein F7R12_01000 [Pseudomonas tolaasii]